MIARLIAGPLGPYLLPILLGVLVAVAGASFYAAWSWQSDRAEAKVNEAVTAAVKDAVKDAQAKLDEERRLSGMYRELAEGKVSALIDKLSRIKVQSVTITNNITKEVESNPTFYGQSIPAGGYAEWMNAKDLLRQGSKAVAPAKPSSGAASSP